jgi:hypothetical protein
MRANQLCLWFASMAYVLLCALRRIALHHTPFAKATCGIIRFKMLKIGALVRVSVRRIKVAMASVCPAAHAWAALQDVSPPPTRVPRPRDIRRRNHMASSTTGRSQSSFALADSQIGAIRLALKAKVLVMTAGEHERCLVSRARPGAPDSQWPLWSSWNTGLGLMLLLMLLNTGWQMRSEEGTNLTHCQWYPLFGLLPREHAYFSVRRQHCGLHGDGVRVRRNVIRQDQYRCLTIAHKVA